MNQQTLEQKLHALRSYPRFEADTIQRFGDVLRRLDDWSLLRMNPLRFAHEHDLDPLISTDLFIHGARVGLFDFSYELLCPSCGGMEYSHLALDEIPDKHFHCTNCNEDVPVTLDDQVQVSFTINPAVRALGLNIYEGPQSYLRYYFSDNYEHSPEVRQYFESNYRGFASVGPDEHGQLAFRAEPGALYRAMNLATHAEIYIQAGAEVSAVPQIVEIDMLAQGFAPERVELLAGSVALSIHNLTKATAGVILYRADIEKPTEMACASLGRWQPFLTGKMLLNNQSFRDLFRIQQLAPGLKLNVRSLTILFTDLKNSTEIYGRAGDAFAYNLVQEHFTLLIDTVRRRSGSIVKTMGDAIMATFSTPEDGVGAALEMVDSIEQLNERLQREGYETGIKIGLNEGPVLAVNADDRLDYFGQNVNVAARVQGLAQAGEIWLTEQIFDNPQVAELLGSSGYRVRKQSAMLRGVAQPTMVYQCVRR